MLQFAEPYLGQKLKSALYKEGQVPDAKRFATVLTFAMLHRLQSISKLPLGDGLPVIDETPYNEWVHWDLLGNGGINAEVIVTNQFVASAEYHGASLHSALRGGITAGTTSASFASRYGTFSWVSMFPFLGASSELVTLRIGEFYLEDSEIAQLAGTLLAHEIGHQLFHLNHPFGNAACLMAPAPMLAFRKWRNGLAPEKCKIGSSEQMTPGAAKLFFMKASR